MGHSGHNYRFKVISKKLSSLSVMVYLVTLISLSMLSAPGRLEKRGSKGFDSLIDIYSTICSKFNLWSWHSIMFLWSCETGKLVLCIMCRIRSLYSQVTIYFLLLISRYGWVKSSYLHLLIWVFNTGTWHLTGFLVS